MLRYMRLRLSDSYHGKDNDGQWNRAFRYVYVQQRKNAGLTLCMRALWVCILCECIEQCTGQLWSDTIFLFTSFKKILLSVKVVPLRINRTASTIRSLPAFPKPTLTHWGPRVPFQSPSLLLSSTVLCPLLGKGFSRRGTCVSNKWCIGKAEQIQRKEGYLIFCTALHPKSLWPNTDPPPYPEISFWKSGQSASG